MHKLWLYCFLIGNLALQPGAGAADGVNLGLADPRVVAAPHAVSGNGGGAGFGPLSATLQPGAVLPGSNQVGRPGISPDNVGGYDVNIAYDHVAVGMAIVGVLFLMTEWMDVR